MTDDRLKTESAGRPWLKLGAAGKSPGVQVWIVGRGLRLQEKLR